MISMMNKLGQCNIVISYMDTNLNNIIDIDSKYIE